MDKELIIELINQIKTELKSDGYDVDNNPVDVGADQVKYNPLAFDIYKAEVKIATILYSGYCEWDPPNRENGLYFFIDDEYESIKCLERCARIDLSDPRFMDLIKKMINVSYPMMRLTYQTQ